jgi:sugar O-acyltransferase (sialic acid O-acetyltransferase NeuD family)
MNNSKANQIIIIGGGNQTKVCIDIVRQMQFFAIAGIVYTKTKPDTDLMGCPVIGSLDDLEHIFKNIATNAAIGIGGLDNPEERVSLFEKLKMIGYTIPNIIHPKSIIEPSVLLGEGNQILGGANIGSCSIIGNNCILNSNCVVSHDCIISDNVNITPGAILSGTVKVGKNSLIGTGAVVRHDITIGKNVIIGAGSVVVKDIPDSTTVIGNPARELVKEPAKKQ